MEGKEFIVFVIFTSIILGICTLAEVYDNKIRQGFKEGLYEAECVIGDKIEIITINDVSRILKDDTIILKDKRFTKECSYGKIIYDDLNVITIE